MGSNRATKYSEVNTAYPHADHMDHEDQAEQYAKKYDFSWKEEGLYDIPAFVDKMLEVTEKPKVVYIGFSKGTT